MTDKELREKAKKDVERLSKGKPRDQAGREYTWNEGKQCFTRTAKDGKLWVKGINSTVPGYWSYCPNQTNVNADGLPVTCNTPHFVFIFQNGEDKKCDGCGETYKIVIKVA